MASERAPWHPDPKLADPLIALLALLEALLMVLSFLGKRGTDAPNAMQDALKHLPLAAQALARPLALVLLAGGLATGLSLLAARREPRPEPPSWRMSGRAVALLLLGWHCAFLLLGVLVQALLGRSAMGRVLSLPLGYGLGAGLGIFLLLRAEGLAWPDLRARVFQGRAGAQWAFGPALLALGFLLMWTASWLLAPLLRGAPAPQRELMDLLRHARGPLPSALLLLTVAGMAPFFEELLIRGFLLPWMRERWGWGRALAASSLVFGLLHLQPSALPALSALGFALGLGVWRTGSLRSSMAAHALWNGGLFFLLRTQGA